MRFGFLFTQSRCFRWNGTDWNHTFFEKSLPLPCLILCKYYRFFFLFFRKCWCHSWKPLPLPPHCPWGAVTTKLGSWFITAPNDQPAVLLLTKQLYTVLLDQFWIACKVKKKHKSDLQHPILLLSCFFWEGESIGMLRQETWRTNITTLIGTSPSQSGLVLLKAFFPFLK